MKELQDLANELNKCLEEKEATLTALDSYTMGLVNNARNEISSFEEHVKMAEKNPAHKRDVIRNFTCKAGEIKLRIDSIDGNG